jgi:hypothetical protein
MVVPWNKLSFMLDGSPNIASRCIVSMLIVIPELSLDYIPMNEDISHQ